MIVLLISTVWLATLALVVSVCRMAAHGDRAQARKGGVSPALYATRSPRLLDMARTHTNTVMFRLEDRRVQAKRADAARSEATTAQYVGHRAQQNLHVGP
jgi:hypothetical protein